MIYRKIKVFIRNMMFLRKYFDVPNNKLVIYFCETYFKSYKFSLLQKNKKNLCKCYFFWRILICTKKN